MKNDIDWTAAQGGALGGLRVLDLTRVLAGPYLTMMLGDLGAEVIKIERPEGDDTRGWGPPFFGDTATYFLAANRNKRSVVFDLTDPRDRSRAVRLAATADVIVENFRPGVTERLGLAYEQLQPINPGVIYCSITAFGDSPQARGLPGYDMILQSVGGLMSITGTTQTGPVKVGVALVDVLAGVHAGFAVLAALRHRDHSGQGQKVEVSMLNVLLASMANQSSAYLGTGDSPTPAGNAHPSIVPYQTLRAADGVVTIACGNDKQFAALTAALGIAELATDPKFSTNTLRVRNRREVIERIEEQLTAMTVGDVIDLLLDAGVPAGPVNDIAGAFRYAIELGLDPVVYIDHGGQQVPQVASPLRMSGTPVNYRRAPPTLGSG